MVNWQEWTIDNPPKTKYVIYYFGNSKVKFGVGYTSIDDNTRIHPRIDFKSVLQSKNATKTLLASYLSRKTNEQIKLYYHPTTKKEKGNGNEDEKSAKSSITNNAFIVFDSEYSKVNFMDKVFVKEVIAIFGKDSDESMFATLIAGDGDLAGRMKRHPRSKKAMENIGDKLLWVDQ